MHFARPACGGGQRRRRGRGRSEAQSVPRGFNDFIHEIDGFQNARVFLLPSIP